MKSLVLSILSVVFLSLSFVCPVSARGKALVGDDVSTMMASRHFTFTVRSIVGLPVDVANTLSLPLSTVSVDADELRVNLPYFSGTGQQNSYNFSTWGRMLFFQTSSFKVLSEGLNKKSTSYTMKIEGYATDQGGFSTTLMFNVGADSSAVLTVTWQGNLVTYNGIITSDN